MKSLKKVFFIFNLLLILSLLAAGCGANETVSTEPEGHTHPDWSYNQTIYEVNVRQYTEEGTFNAFAEHLPELKEMGVGILWFMPIHPIGEKNRKGSLGSYYAVKDYKAVNPEFGTEEDFRNVVKKAHELGMYVIIDWVANHTAWDNVWVEEHPEFFTKDSAGNFIPPVEDWADVIDLNYENKDLWPYMTDALKYWVSEFDIDGYRCDVAAMVPGEFWIQAVAGLDSIKHVFMLAEASEPELHEQGFDMTYNWQLKGVMNNVASGEKNANAIRDHFADEDSAYGENDFRMTFTSNHDENTWHGSAIERLGDGAEAFAVLTATVEGMPLIYSGQEAGIEKRLEFFEKDPIEWKNHRFREVYTELFNLNMENEALFNGKAGGQIVLLDVPEENEKVLAFTREKNGDKILAVFNFSGDNVSAKVKGKTLEGNYGQLFAGGGVQFTPEETFNLGPWDYNVYYFNSEEK